ncbi:hypothetical protein F2Q68_00024300 [Brassica cretica]|uniref:Uncharacterized protein n=1 Tax=Brassica cretica TaxID=69181 RepID=A0A8S9IGG2_BRACR|nr:hypothetical protein F2Q68_00024300 [Brassica cretica]
MRCFVGPYHLAHRVMQDKIVRYATFWIRYCRGASLIGVFVKTDDGCMVWPVEVDLNFLEPVGKELKLLCEEKKKFALTSSLPATKIKAPFLLSFVDAGSDLARRRRLRPRPSPLMPRFKSASISIAAAVPFISAATAAPFVSDATPVLFVSTITATVSNSLGSSVLMKSTVSYAVRLSGDSRKAMSSGSSAPRIPCRCSSVLRVPWCCGSYFWCVRSVTQGSVFVDPRRKRNRLLFHPNLFHFISPPVLRRHVLSTRPATVAKYLSYLRPVPPDVLTAPGHRLMLPRSQSLAVWIPPATFHNRIQPSWLSSGKHSSEMDMVSLILAKSQRISGGFIEVEETLERKLLRKATLLLPSARMNDYTTHVSVSVD